MIEAWHVWLALGLLLVLAELLGTEFVLLALGLSCLTGVLIAGFTAASFGQQLLGTAITAVVLVPLVVIRFRRWTRPRGGYGVTGTGAERGALAEVIEQAGEIGIRYRGDFLPARFADDATPSPGERVRVERISGITAVVETVDRRDVSHSLNQKD